jgi:hypothetical protein
MVDQAYNPMKAQLELLKRELDNAKKINDQHQVLNGKLRMEINNLKFENKKYKNKLNEILNIKEKETDDTTTPSEDQELN